MILVLCDKKGTKQLVASTRIIQTEWKYEKIWSACFTEGKSQVWLNPKEDMKYYRKLTLCLATMVFRPFDETKGHKAPPAW